MKRAQRGLSFWEVVVSLLLISAMLFGVVSVKNRVFAVANYNRIYSKLFQSWLTGTYTFMGRVGKVPACRQPAPEGELSCKARYLQVGINLPVQDAFPGNDGEQKVVRLIAIENLNGGGGGSQLLFDIGDAVPLAQHVDDILDGDEKALAGLEWGHVRLGPPGDSGGHTLYLSLDPVRPPQSAPEEAPTVAAPVIRKRSSKSYLVLLENEDGTSGKVIISGAQGEVTVDQAGFGARLDGSTKNPVKVDAEALSRDFGAVMKARPPLPVHFQLYFKSGGAELTEESRAQFGKIIASVRNRPAPSVSIIGHSDTVGDADRNATLALERARAVATLITASGLRAQELNVESHGETNLLVKTPDNTPEPKNRRVEITIR